MKFKKRIAAVTMMLAMLVSCVFGVSAFAATPYTAINGASNACTIKKYLIFDSTNVPSADFSFSITGPSVVTTDGSASGTPSITSTASFSSSSTIYTSSDISTEGDQVTLSNGERYAKQPLTVDLSNVTFSEPGIYRFTITESGTNPGVTNDSTTTLYLDVYVEDDGNGNLVIQNGSSTKGYVLHSDNTQLDQNGQLPAPSTKPDGFKNKYESNELTITKTVTGNQGSKDKYFKYQVNFTDLAPNGVYAVTVKNSSDQAIATVPAGAATLDSYEGESEPTAITANASGAASAVFYLSHGDVAVINGLPGAAKYTVTETPEDYACSATASGDADVTANAPTCSDSTTGITADTTCAFTNNRAGVIPTGIIVKFLPYALAFMAAAFGLIVVLAAKKRSAAR